MSLPDRRLSTAVFLIGAIVFVLLAWLWVPWQWVPGGHYEHIAAREVFSPAQIARSEHYSSLQRHLSWIGYTVALIAALVLGLTRLGRDIVGRIRGPWWVRVPAAAFLVLLIGQVVTLWFNARIQHNELAFGLSRQPWSAWWRDLGTGLVVAWVGTELLA